MRNLKNEICFCLNQPNWESASYESEKYILTLENPHFVSIDYEKSTSGFIIKRPKNLSTVMRFRLEDKIMLQEINKKEKTTNNLSGNIFMISKNQDIIDFNFDFNKSVWLKAATGVDTKTLHKNSIEMLEQLYAFMEPLSWSEFSPIQNSLAGNGT